MANGEYDSGKLSIDRILQSQGFGSRKECRQAIQKGIVKVNGSTQRGSAAIFETGGLILEWGDTRTLYRKKIYLALNKPAGYECSAKPQHHPSVLGLVDELSRNRGVQPAGRLDQDSSGLLILSDDGSFIHSLASPKSGIPKTYRASTARPLDAGSAEILMGGVLLRGEEKPLRALACRQTGEKELEITVDQGKYHMVRRMIAALGNHCELLTRTAIGGLELDSLGLEPGQYRHLENTEMELLGVKRWL